MKMAISSVIWVLVLVPTWGLRLGGPTNIQVAEKPPDLCGAKDTLVKLIGYHKMGTYLSNAGGQCIQEYFSRQNMPAFAWTRGTKCQVEANLFKRTTEVHWTREPQDWVISNYLYHKRGDEALTCYMDWLRIPANFKKLQKHRPSIPILLDNEPNYTHYLQRISEEDGLVSELFRMSRDDNCEASLHELVRESKGINGFSVCLEDFMQGHSRFTKTWHMILKNVSGSEGDAEFDECLAPSDVSLMDEQTEKHETRHSVTEEDHARMHRLISKFDAATFGGLYANASKEIGCDRASFKTLAKLHAVESTLKDH